MDDTFNIVISGSREFTEFQLFANTLDDVLKINRTKNNIRLLEDGARGIDKLALHRLKETSWGELIPLLNEEFPKAA